MKCLAIKKDGKQCTRNASSGSYCGQHSKTSLKTITITFGDCAENHVGMEIIKVEHPVQAMSTSRLLELREQFSDYNTEIIDLGDDASVLIVREYAQGHFTRLSELQWDKEAKIRGKVKNKRARWNLIIHHTAQDPDYESGRGRIISWDSLPELTQVREQLESICGGNLIAEGNYYYSSSCGIGFHGDSERHCVIGLRCGDSIPLVYQWFKEYLPLKPCDNTRTEIILNDGDLYFMSEKAVGRDWKCPSKKTLRHAAGSSKYTIYKP